MPFTTFPTIPGNEPKDSPIPDAASPVVPIADETFSAPPPTPKNFNAETNFEIAPAPKDITPKAADSALYPKIALHIISNPLATSSGLTLSIQFSIVERKLSNAGLFTKSARLLDNLSMKIRRPSPIVSAKGSRCSQNSESLFLIDSQSTLLLKSVIIRSSSGNPFSIVHFPSGSRTFS